MRTMAVFSLAAFALAALGCSSDPGASAGGGVDAGAAVATEAGAPTPASDGGSFASSSAQLQSSGAIKLTRSR